MTIRSPVLSVLLFAVACAPAGEAPEAAAPAVADSTGIVLSIAGLDGPEAVRYDADQDVYFIANFAGSEQGDSNGFISRVRGDGTVDSLRFMVGSALGALHGPRGMFITGDTLWVADHDGVHGFDRRSGTHVAFVDFRPFQPGFLNDIVQGPDGALYVTDTGVPRVFRLAGREVTVAIEDPRLGPPNGITWDAAGNRFLLAGWGDGGMVRAWVPGTTEVTDVGTLATGRFDGLELVDGMLLIASQTDSSIHTLRDGQQVPVIRTPGQPADIGIDTQRRRIAVPYIALNRVDIWALP